ncbi:MAG: YdiY family protein [Gammaproteobacteria bacterium]
MTSTLTHACALTVAAACGSTCSNAGATTPTLPSTSGWHTSAELGAITTSGNTAGTSVTGKIDARQERDRWSNQYIATGFFKEDVRRSSGAPDDTVTTAKRFALSSKFAYRLGDDNERAYLLATHVEDKFGPFVEYSTLGVGRSTRWLQSVDKTLDVELGPGYFSGARPNGDTESGLTVRGAAALRWQLTPSALFSQTVSVERGTSNVHSSAEAALSTKINDTMQMKAAFVARNDTNVPEFKKNTDTQTSVTLVYSF